MPGALELGPEGAALRAYSETLADQVAWCVRSFLSSLPIFFILPPDVPNPGTRSMRNRYIFSHGMNLFSVYVNLLVIGQLTSSLIVLFSAK